jgi:hypothetical protein
MQIEIGGDLLERHTGIASESVPDVVVSELLGRGLGHVDIRSDPPPLASQISCHHITPQSPTLGLRWRR